MGKGPLFGKSKPKADAPAKPGKKNKVEDDNGPGVNLHDMGSPSGLSAGGGRGKAGSKGNAPQAVPSAGRHNDRSPSNADDLALYAPNGQYGGLPGSRRNEYDAMDSPLDAPATTTPPGHYHRPPAQRRANDGPAPQAQPVGGHNPNQPIASTNHGQTGNYDRLNSNMLLPAPIAPTVQIRGPSNAALFFRKITPETKKGAAVYAGLFVVVAGIALGVPGGLGLFATTNQPTLPTVKDANIAPGTGDKATGYKKNAVAGFDLKTLVEPFDSSDDAAINPASFLLYGKTDSTDPGSTTVDRQGTWAVSDQGILTYTPASNVEFGTAQILFSVADKLGRRSNRATVNVNYGPKAGNFDLKDLDLQKETQPISLSETVSAISSAKDAEVDFTTLQLVYRDKAPNGTNGDVIGTTVTVPMVGVWKVTNGSVTFAPVTDFVGTMVSIGYQVKDKRGILSNEGTIVLAFKPKSMEMPPKDMMAKPMLGYMPNISVNTAPRTEIMISSMGTLASNSLEVSTTETGVYDKSVVVSGQGKWVVTGNALAFERSPNFLGAPSPIFYRAKSTANVQSDVFQLTLDIFPPPLTLDDSFAGLRATIDVLQNDRVQYTLEGNALDRNSLQFMKVVTDNPVDPVPQISSDGKKAVVPGQGEWEIIQLNQRVTFTPVAGFAGPPLPMYYSIKDTKGSESRPTKITINPEAAAVATFVNSLLKLDPGEFWRSFVQNFANSPLDEVLVATFLAARLLSKDFNAAQLMNISAQGVGLSESDRTRLFTTWMMAKFSVANLVDQVDKLGQSKLNFPDQGGLVFGQVQIAVLQVLRLREMIVAMDKYFDTLAAMRK